jgi:hypothetical protein
VAEAVAREAAPATHGHTNDILATLLRRPGLAGWDDV